jgi:hypothetical protein
VAVRPVAAPASQALAIAGFGLDFKSDSAGIISVLKGRYGRFASGASSGLKFSVGEAPGRESPFRPSVLFKDDRLELRRGDFSASLDLRVGTGSLSARASEQCLDAFLRSLISSRLLRAGGFMLHCAGLVKKGRAYLFLGRSGAGKSTLSKLAAGAGCEVISDEINLLRPRGKGFRVHGSPFWGEMRADGRQGSWPLGGVYLLEKAGANRLAPCGGGEAMKLLLRCLLNFEKGPDISALVLNNAAALLGKTFFYRLEFSKKNAAFLELI